MVAGIPLSVPLFEFAAKASLKGCSHIMTGEALGA
jgi:hypothetical protein